MNLAAILIILISNIALKLQINEHIILWDINTCSNYFFIAHALYKNILTYKSWQTSIWIDIYDNLSHMQSERRRLLAIFSLMLNFPLSVRIPCSSGFFTTWKFAQRITLEIFFFNDCEKYLNTWRSTRIMKILNKI